ncbi:hypothetical protein AX16_007867 [Volvariella volvacea WC 439]|nr:hypothetical protein AX16_007867 [Volvariella volvacea WC 439]
MSPIPNIILFGASGCGKSSIINMLFGSTVARTSPDVTGCTFESHCYQVSIFGQTFNIWDTAGLEEEQRGTVPNMEAIVKLYGLLRSLEDGVNLLIFCMRAPRMSESAPHNWSLFHDIICDKKVPIVVIVTALELQSGEPGGMDSWWFNNKKHFERFGIVPTGHACITTIRGKEVQPGIFAYGQEYEESKERVSRLIMSTSLETAWNVPRTEWFKQILHTTYESKCFSTKELKELRTVVGPGIQKMVRSCGMSEDEATTLANALERFEKGHANILIYGEPGAEQNALINMLGGRSIAITSADSPSYDVDIQGESFRLWDIAGLRETGGVSAGATQKLIDLVGDQLYGSVSLIVYHLRVATSFQNIAQDYNTLFKIICQGNVPMVLVFADVDRKASTCRWIANKSEFDRRGLKFSGHACITLQNTPSSTPHTDSGSPASKGSERRLAKLILENRKVDNTIFEDIEKWRSSCTRALGRNANGPELGTGGGARQRGTLTRQDVGNFLGNLLAGLLVGSLGGR